MGTMTDMAGMSGGVVPIQTLSELQLREGPRDVVPVAFVPPLKLQLPFPTPTSLHDLSGDDSAYIRAIQADVDPSVVNGSVGWELDVRGCGVGRHFADRFQDSLLVKPDISGAFYRTTLVQADDKWFVLELCERTCSA